ncbi:hypothetical protein SROCM77S_02009 [Streptomyces rochei]
MSRAADDLLPLAAAEPRYCSPTPRSRATGDAIGVAPPAFVIRVGGRLGTRPGEDGDRVVAVAEPSVIRAAPVHVLKAPPSTYWNLDVRPLSATTVTGRAGRWNLRFEGVPA